MVAGYDYGTKTVNDLLLMAKNKQLNLSPAFQRQSVWSVNDRRKLIASLLDERPLPSIFLHRNEAGPHGKLSYDVIDGKQRLETIFMFMGTNGFGSDSFVVKHLKDDGEYEWFTWVELTKTEQNLILATKLQIVETQWDLGDVVRLFVDINSTGKRLTGAEKLHAKYVTTPFLKHASRVAEDFRPFFKRQRVFSEGQIARMKHVELSAELLASLHAGGPINKKRELDRLIAGGTIDAASLNDATTRLRRALKDVEMVFPRLSETRVRTSTELYSLVLILDRLREDGHALGTASRRQLAQQMLINFGVGVDTVSLQLPTGKGIKAEQSLYLDYISTVRSDTDSRHTRLKRQRILEGVLAGIFEKTDSTRAFSPTQRRILWHSTAEKKCAWPGCSTKLTWNDFTVDHITPHVNGGATNLSNAQLMCKHHNSKKGAN
jgi:hypothetical protein